MATIQVTAVGAPRSLAVGVTVQLTALPAGATSYQWSFIDKAPTSVASLATPTAQTSQFVVDAEGSYYIRCIIVLANGSVEEAKVLLSCPFLTDEGEVHLPAAGETFEADAMKGWAPAVQQALRISTLAYKLASQLVKSNKLRAARVASTGNLVLAGAGQLTVDGFGLLPDDNVLVRAQTDQKENGLYVYAEAGGNYTLTRSPDADEDADYVSLLVVIEVGTYADQVFVQLVDQPQLGVTNIIFGLLGANLPTVLVPAGTAELAIDGARRLLRWDDGLNVYEVELGVV